MPDGQTEWERRSAHERGQCCPNCEHHTSHNALWRRIAAEPLWPVALCVALLGLSFGGGAYLLVRIFGGL